MSTPYGCILAFESRITNTETYSKLCQASKMGFLVKIVKATAKRYTLDFRQGSEYRSANVVSVLQNLKLIILKLIINSQRANMKVILKRSLDLISETAEINF